jgi:glutamate-1-semialdehyde 2,1-aminomutase
MRSSAARRASASSARCSASYHPVVVENVKLLKEISGLDEVSFHMSGTEAVMQAVRLARYHTRRRIWCGFAAPIMAGGATCNRASAIRCRRRHLHAQGHVRGSLRVLRTRRDIACVLVNPLQALHPNARAPSDSALLDSGRRAFRQGRPTPIGCEAPARGVHRANIVLIFDEVFVGFRLARGGAQDYFGVRADLVTYGKTLGGGLPIGVVCGRKRFDETFPRRPAGRYLLCPRHLQFAPLRHGGDERIPAPSADAEEGQALYRNLDGSGTSARKAPQ